MKKFIKDYISEFNSTFSIMMVIFIGINLFKNNEMISLNLLFQMMMLAFICSFLILLCYKNYVLKKTPEYIRIILFVIAFAVISYILIVGLGWFSINDNSFDSWKKFYKIFVFTFAIISLVIFILIFEKKYQKTGKEYTERLNKYKEERLDEK